MQTTLCNICMIEDLATGRILVRHRPPKVSTTFLQLHISERTGRGIPKIINAYDRGIFEFGENTISVILPYNRLEVEAQTPQVEGQTPQVDTPVDAQVRDLTPKSRVLPPKSRVLPPKSRVLLPKSRVLPPKSMLTKAFSNGRRKGAQLSTFSLSFLIFAPFLVQLLK